MSNHTSLAAELFPISGEPVHLEIIKSLIQIKRGEAIANSQLEVLDQDKSDRIVTACDQLLDMDDEALAPLFPIDVFQTGSGTNTNMNVNEVIAERSETHPNNDVNYGQSSNDTFPSAIQIAATKQILGTLIPNIKQLIESVQNRASQLKDKVKTGRTHSMDAMPITFGTEMTGWQVAVEESVNAIEQSLTTLQKLPLGGTAVGTGINAHPKAPQIACLELNKSPLLKGDLGGFKFEPHPSPASRMGSQHVLLNASNALTLLATTINKIASDLILMNSGPLCGFGDISLPSHIDGSSIMPGKVNPVIPESACQVYARVMGNHTMIQCGTSNSRLQLNVYLPVMGNALLNSIQILANTCKNLCRDIDGFTVNDENIAENLSRNPILVTGLNKIIGYDLGKQIVKKALAEKRALIDVAEEMTDLSRAKLEDALDPSKLASN